MLLYITTVILKRPEKEFWCMVPRKFNALVEAHSRVNGSDEASGESSKTPKATTGFIDQVI